MSKTHQNTPIFAVIGDPISHSASPNMHNAAFSHLNIPGHYIPIHVKPDDLPLFIQSVKAFNIDGFNVTVPHKEAIMPHLDAIDPMAERIGAVNTVVNTNGQLIGYNTDGDGFINALLHGGGFIPEDKNVAIIGAGGTARAIGFTLLRNKINELTIINRSKDRGKALADELSKYSQVRVVSFSLDNSMINDLLVDLDLLVNTTSVGMNDDTASPLNNFDWVKRDKFVYDVIYTPAKTRLLRECEARGATVLGGAGMLAGQGLLAFEHFTGHTVPFDIMKREVDAWVS